MSLLLLIDGYNVIAPVAPPGRMPDPRWLQRERNQLVQRLVEHLPADLRSRTCVVFDAADPPADRPPEFIVDQIEIKFAVGYPEADDLLEDLIATHSVPKQLAVVSSDRRVQAAARRRGAPAFESQAWLDHLLDGRLDLAIQLDSGAGQGSGEQSDKPKSIAKDEVQQWLDEFGL